MNSSSEHCLKGKRTDVLQNLAQEMEKASEELEFEKAAALLSTIRQIEHVTQSANLSFQARGKNTDVLGFHREGDLVLLIRLLFREGNLVGSEPFFFQNVVEENEEVLSSFILQQYGKIGAHPEEIILPMPLPDEKALLSILQDLQIKRVKFSYPQKGTGKELMLLAEKNAKTTFEQKRSDFQSSEVLLFDLQEALGLSRYPRRIECFDTSNLSGHSMVAAVVVFIDGKEDPKRGRLYHVKDVDKPDDYAALHQVLTRRLLRCKEEEDLPDLILIDGGKGQLNIALSVIQALDIASVDVASLVKDQARHDKGITLERVCLPGVPDPISFAFHSPLLFFLQNIRDRAHAKACGFHRKTRAKKTIFSALDSIPGIGPAKKRKLLSLFGSLQNILSQTEETLQNVPGLTKKDVENIKKIAF